MRSIRVIRVLACAVPFAATLLLGASSRAAEDSAVQKTLKTLVNSIRYNKDDIAAKQLAYGTMAKGLVADSWDKLKPEEQKEFVADLEVLLRKLSFPKGREMFQYLDAVQYSAVEMKGEEAHCKSTVVVHRDVKKTEIPIEWVLVKDGGQWKVLDTITTGESTIHAIREDQVVPLLKEGGTTTLMDALRKKTAEVQKS